MLQIGDRAPEFHLWEVNGPARKLADYLAGDHQLLFIFLRHLA